MDGPKLTQTETLRDTLTATERGLFQKNRTAVPLSPKGGSNSQTGEGWTGADTSNGDISSGCWGITEK